MQLDDKEKNIIKHYKELIEQRKFDEYDILGFLICIRGHIDKKKYPSIHEFADLIAIVTEIKEL